MHDQQEKSVSDLQTWLTSWPGARREMEELIVAHTERNPSMYFEPALAELELKDIDEAVQRAKALARLLGSDELMSSAEMQGTGNC